MKKKRYVCSCGWSGDTFDLSWEVGERDNAPAPYYAWGVCPEDGCTEDLEEMFITEEDLQTIKDAGCDITTID